MTRTIKSFLAPLALVVLLSGCAAHRVPVLAGQSVLAGAQTIHALQLSVKQLADAHVIPISQALVVENALLQANDTLRPVPALLRAIDSAEKANQPDQPLIIQTISLIDSVSKQLKVVIYGMPVSDATKQVLDLANQLQQTYTTLLTNLNTLKK